EKVIPGEDVLDLHAGSIIALAALRPDNGDQLPELFCYLLLRGATSAVIVDEYCARRAFVREKRYERDHLLARPDRCEERYLVPQGRPSRLSAETAHRVRDHHVRRSFND